MIHAYADKAVADLIARHKTSMLSKEHRVEKTLLGWQVITPAGTYTSPKAYKAKAAVANAAPFIEGIVAQKAGSMVEGTCKTDTVAIIVGFVKETAKYVVVQFKPGKNIWLSRNQFGGVVPTANGMSLISVEKELAKQKGWV